MSTVAETVEQITGGRFEYIGATERGKAQRRVLHAAWAHRGLTDERVMGEAYGPEAEEGPQTKGGEGATIFVMTPDCSKWSSNTSGAHR